MEIEVFGTDFFWPMTSPNPYYEQIPGHIDIIISHGPCKGFADGGSGCETLLQHVHRANPRLVVGGKYDFIVALLYGLI